MYKFLTGAYTTYRRIGIHSNVNNLSESKLCHVFNNKSLSNNVDLVTKEVDINKTDSRLAVKERVRYVSC
jgi:hypothetical protein